MTKHKSALGHLTRGNPAHRNKTDDETADGSTSAKAQPTRMGRVWIAVSTGAIVFVLLLIFILQNTAGTAIEFLVWDWSLPLGVALLFAALAGLLVMAMLATARIWQLRHAYRTATQSRNFPNTA